VKVPSKAELIHYKIQAAMRENIFQEDQMKYLGLIEDFEVTNGERQND